MEQKTTKTSIYGDFISLNRSLVNTLTWVFYIALSSYVVCCGILTNDFWVSGIMSALLLWSIIKINPYITVAMYALRRRIKGCFTKKISNVSEQDVQKRELLIQQTEKLVRYASINDHYNYKVCALAFDKLYMSFDNLDYAKYVRDYYFQHNIRKWTICSLYYCGRFGVDAKVSYNKNLNIDEYVKGLCDRVYLAAADDDYQTYRQLCRELNATLPRYFRKRENEIYAITHQWYSQNPEKADVIFKYYLERL